MTALGTGSVHDGGQGAVLDAPGPAKDRNLDCGVDALEQSLISGWARYRDRDTPVEVELVINGRGVGTIRADRIRGDLKKIRPDGAFAFGVQISLDKHPQRTYLAQEAKVFLRDARTGAKLRNSDRVWSGLAPKGQEGLKNSQGQYLHLSGKGGIFVPHGERSDAWRIQLLSDVRQLADDAKAGGFIIAAAYGTLLGAVRDGAMIPHDNDVDVMLIASSSTMLGAVDEFRAFQAYLLEHGYTLGELTNGQIHAHPRAGVTVDVFLAWFEDDRLNLTFTVKAGPARADVLPLGSVRTEGVDLPAPRNPQPLLEAIYGPGWTVPDPSFNWRRPADVQTYFAPIHNYRRSANADYWTAYYAAKSAMSPPDYPSQFAIFALGLGRETGLIVDLGCGSGRDSIYFASLGKKVIGVDYAATAVAENSSRAQCRGLQDTVAFIQCDVSNLHDVRGLISDVSNRRGSHALCVYSRFFLHAIDACTEGAALVLTRELLSQPADFAVFEFRTDKDQGREKTTAEHFRRYVNVDHLLARAAGTYGLECIYRVEGTGYAVFGSDDAYVARIVLRAAQS